MNKFNELFAAVNENIAGLKFKTTPDIGSDNETSGHSPGEEGYDIENVEYSNTSTDLEQRIKDLIMNSDMYEPSITEDDEDINNAIKEFLHKIKYKK